MKHLELVVDAVDRTAEPLDEYLQDHPSAMLRFLDAAEHYWQEEHVERRPPRNVVLLNVAGR